MLRAWAAVAIRPRGAADEVTSPVRRLENVARASEDRRMTARAGFQSVDEYIAAQPAPARPVLARVRATIRRALPGATEGISYQIPIYELDGRMVLYFAGFKSHYSVYPATPRVVGALEDELSGLLHSKATIRFPLDAAVPTRLIARIAKLRAAEIAELGKAKPVRRATSRKVGRAARGTSVARRTSAKKR
jgi:uncharacterized protein YdhG (YjbR/CyaY superfamily)